MDKEENRFEKYVKLEKGAYDYIEQMYKKCKERSIKLDILIKQKAREEKNETLCNLP